MSSTTDVPLEKQIDAVGAKLVELLDEQRRKDRTSNQSFWPTCEAAGDGYVGCDPLKLGMCPDESEFATTLADKPYANAWSKDPVTGRMMRCVPPYLVGKPVESTQKEKSDLRRIMEALIKIEQNYTQATKDAAFQWNTPCNEAQNLNQCEIMRDAPSYNAEGKLTYAQHGTRCMWRPLEDTRQYIEDASTDPSTAKCIDRFDHPYEVQPLTKDELERIKAQLSEAGTTDMHIADMQEVSTPYGQQRVVTTDKLRDLQDAMVTLPIMPFRSTLESFQAWFSRASEKGGWGLDVDIDAIDDSAAQANEAAHKMYVSTDTFAATIYDRPGPAIIQGLKALCEAPSSDETSFVWQAAAFEVPGTMGKWLVPQSVAAADDVTARSYEGRLKKLIETSAQTSWSQFAVQNAKHQQTWLKTIEALARNLAAALTDSATRKQMELTLAPLVQNNGRNDVYVDLSLYNPDFFDINETQYGTGVASEIGSAVDLHKVKVTQTPQLTNTSLQERLRNEPLLKFKAVPTEKRATPQQHWRELAVVLAYRMWQGSTVAPSETQKDQQFLRTLHNRGLGGHKWNANITGKVKVSATHSALSPSEVSHMQKILRDIKALKKQELGQRLSSKIMQEKSANVQNRATLAYFATLNAEHDIEERYRLAIAQITKMLQYNFNRAKLVEFTANEIKRRFHNSPGHPLYYNRSGRPGGPDLRTEAAQALIRDAQAKLDVVKKSVADERDHTELREALERFRDELKQSIRDRVPHKELRANTAVDFQSKFGAGSYIDPITGASAKQLLSMAKV